MLPSQVLHDFYPKPSKIWPIKVILHSFIKLPLCLSDRKVIYLSRHAEIKAYFNISSFTKWLWLRSEIRSQRVLVGNTRSTELIRKHIHKNLRQRFEYMAWRPDIGITVVGLYITCISKRMLPDCKIKQVFKRQFFRILELHMWDFLHSSLRTNAAENEGAQYNKYT